MPGIYSLVTVTVSSSGLSCVPCYVEVHLLIAINSLCLLVPVGI